MIFTDIPVHRYPEMWQNVSLSLTLIKQWTPLLAAQGHWCYNLLCQGDNTITTQYPELLQYPAGQKMARTEAYNLTANIVRTTTHWNRAARINPIQVLAPNAGTQYRMMQAWMVTTSTIPQSDLLAE